MSPLGTVGELFYFQDYWHPPSIFSTTVGPVPLLLEDFLFMFAIAGIGTTLYKIFFRKRTQLMEPVPTYRLGIISSSVIATVFLLALWFGTSLNSIFVTSLWLLFLTALIILERPDLASPALSTGLLFMLTVLVVYTICFALVSRDQFNFIIEQIWFLHGTPLDIRFGRVPVTELIWSFPVGTALGILYSFVTKQRIVAARGNG